MQKYDPHAAVKFHDFPQDKDLRTLWKESCGLANHSSVENLKVCCDHFEADDYEILYGHSGRCGDYIKRLKLNAVPRCNLGMCNTEDASDVFQEVNLNHVLKSQLDSLQKEKVELQNKVREMNSKLIRKINVTQKWKRQYDRMKKKRNVQLRKNLLMKVFSSAQIGILMGQKKVVWSDDDLATAFTLRQMSNKGCYLYLKETLNIPLPSLSCVQKWAASLQET